MCAKKRHRTGRDFLHYLKDDLSKQERHELERGLEADPFEKEAMEGFESIQAERVEEDLLSLHAALGKRLRRKKRRTWYGIAATAASILIVGTIFLNIYELNPEDAEREALSEETFRSLDSDDEKASPKIAPEQESAKQNISRAKESVPTQAKKTTPSEKQEAEQDMEVAEDLKVMEFVIADDAVQEVEAVPREKALSVRKSKRAIMADEGLEQVPVEEVSGIILSSEDLDPLPGASIMIRGTNSGTVADMEGRFSLPAEDSQTMVVASFLGMETQEFQLKSESENQLVMQPDIQTLDEIVIVAQGDEGISEARTSSTITVTQEETTPSHIPAEPEQGYRALKKYMEENMRFPGDYIPGERKVVILRFTVRSDGSITDVQALRTPKETYTLEAIRLIMEGPEWTPARMNSDPIDEQVRVRIVFKK